MLIQWLSVPDKSLKLKTVKSFYGFRRLGRSEPGHGRLPDALTTGRVPIAANADGSLPRQQRNGSRVETYCESWGWLQINEASLTVHRELRGFGAKGPMPSQSWHKQMQPRSGIAWLVLAIRFVNVSYSVGK